MQILRSLSLCLMFSAFPCSDAMSDETPDRPNIIYILADDLGYGDLSCYGQQRFQTPNIDRLANEGIRFTDHYAGSTVCAPSRASLMTGRHIGHCLVRGNYATSPHGFGGGLPLRNVDVTIAETLKQAGYRTGLFGKWGLGIDGTSGEPNKQGFDYAYGLLNQAHAHHYYPEYIFRNGKKEPIIENAGGERKVYIPDRITDESLKFIDRNRDHPFFIFFALTTPHAELLVPKDSLQEFAGRWPETPFVRNGSGGGGFSETFGAYASQPTPRAAFAAMIKRMDSDVGRILAKLKETGLDKNTIVMFSSDNGPHLEGGADPEFFNSSGGLKGRKRDLYEGGIRVPLVARWPEKIKAGTTSDFPSAFWDIMPTCAELASADSPKQIDGTSLVSALLGKNTQDNNRTLYWEFHERGYTEQAARRGNWKMVRHGPKQPLELYDLNSDVEEQHNVASSNPTVVAKFQQYLQTARTPSEIWPLADRESKRVPVGGRQASKRSVFRDLFNGKDLTGWVDVNTSPATWSVRDQMLICSGKPIGVLRTDRQYENFVLQVEWRHMEAGGNSGVFLWTDAIPQKNRLPKGMEVQMLELDWVNQREKLKGVRPPEAYVHGELFGAGGMTAIPDNPRGNRSKSYENRCKGRGQWNQYEIVAVDGTVKLAINGKFVNGIREASYKKGYLCLESEGAEIHFRNLRIMELLGGMADDSNTAPLLDSNTNK